MNRREALRNVALLMGGAISASTLSFISTGCKTDNKKGEQLFTVAQQSIITELADTIIPPTRTPGAKAAGVGPFIAMMIAECYPDKIQKIFIAGLKDLDRRAESKFSDSFANITPQQRTAVLQDVVNELKMSRASGAEKPKADGGKKAPKASLKKNTNFFQLAKELTMLGYFTSEIGAKQALDYLPVPGKYIGCMEMKPGQKAWAL